MSLIDLSIVLLLANVAWALKSVPVVSCGYNSDQKQQNECLLNNLQSTVPKLVHGDSELGIPNMDPLDIMEIVIYQGSDQVGLKITIYDCKMYGISNNKFVNASVDLKNRRMEWDIENDSGFQILGNYKASVKVLIPISATGKISIIMTGIKAKFYVDFEITKQKGIEYIVITNLTMTHDVNRLYLKLGNLFNGYKLLGDTMNQFLNENSKQLAKEFGPMAGNSLAGLFKKLLSSVLSQTPFNTLFPGKKS